jgi:cell division septum initiation protein DivIVA
VKNLRDELKNNIVYVEELPKETEVYDKETVQNFIDDIETRLDKILDKLKIKSIDDIDAIPGAVEELTKLKDALY